METVNIPVGKETFERLQKLATPLVDSVDSVVRRLLDYNDKLVSGEVKAIAIPPNVEPMTAVLYRGPKKHEVQIGTKLTAHYLKHSFEAVVVRGGILYMGKVYDSPSAAAIAAKKSVGASDTQASTNGWEFWKVNQNGSLRSLDDYRVTSKG